MASKDNITFVVGGVSGGGAERVVCDLANFFVKKNNNVTIITTSDDDATYYLDSSIKRICLITSSERKNYIYNAFIRWKRLKRYIKEHPWHNYVGFLPITTIMLLLLRKYIKGKVVVSERSDPQRYNFIIKKFLYRLSERANKVVFQTSAVKQVYEKHNSKINGIVIPNAVLVEAHNSKSVKERDKRIVSVGRLEAVKNQELLIRAFTDVVKDFPDYTLHFYGDGALREKLKKLTEELVISEKVAFHGFITDVKKDIINAAVFVLPSNHEGMPNSLMEAMAMGLPCIATDCPSGGVRSLIRDKENGLLIPVNDKVALIEAIKNILINDNLSNHIVNEAIKVGSDYSPDIIYNKWFKIISK